MTSFRNAIAVLLVLLATGTAVALATEPAAAPATESAAAIAITYRYSPEMSKRWKPLDGALVRDPFYVFLRNLPADFTQAHFFIDSLATQPVGKSYGGPFRYDPSSLSHGPHRLIVLLKTSSSTYQVEADFSVGGEVGHVQFSVISDSHICNADYPPEWDDDRCHCCKKTQKERRRDQLAEVGGHTSPYDDFVISLGDAIEDLNFYHDHTTPRYYFKYVRNHFPKKPHYTVFGNHDIRDYGYYAKSHKTIQLPKAVELFQRYSDPDTGYDVGPFIPVSDTITTTLTNDWHFLLMHSGEEVNSWAEGSCVRFSQEQLDWLDAYLRDEVSGKTAILFWHVSPEGEIRGGKFTAEICRDVCKPYLSLLRTHAPKIKAIITGHVHEAKSYIWDTTVFDKKLHPYGTVKNNDTRDYNPTSKGKIMMLTAPSTGQPKDWQKVKYPHLFLEVSLDPDGTLYIDNKDSVHWKPISLSELPALVSGESRYTQADSCFEQDNDGDGWFDDDKIDCPGGTYLGTELDNDQQTYTIEAELRQSCKVRNYTPGEYDAVSSVDIGETALETLAISQHYEKCTNGTPPISKLNAKRDGGAVAVVVAGPDGVARQIANANTRDYTDQASGITVVAVDHYDRYTEAHLRNVPEEYHVSLYVKFEPGLTGELIPEASSCDVETSVWLDYDYDHPEVAEYFGLEVVVPNAKPELISPPDGSSTSGTAPAFAWSAVTGASSYQIQVDDDEDSASAEIDSEVSGTSFAPAAPLPAGSYHWRVRADTDCGHGAWSSTWSIKQLRSIHLPIVANRSLWATGWAIGDDETGTPVIVHTADGGLTWQAQGDLTAWKGSPGTDISAVDDRTAWAALGSADAVPGGAILHTKDGGTTWFSQTIPGDLKGGVKSIKGLSRREAWAASLGGTILHTTDGGTTWNAVPHPTVPIYQVNRMDAIGDNVWIADAAGPDPLGAVVHTQDGGRTWRAEHLPWGDEYNSALTVHAFSPEVVWASGSLIPDPGPVFYRTLDGGVQWESVINVAAFNHLDDICAAGPDDVWGVMNTSGAGVIWRVHVEPDGQPAKTDVTPKGLAHITEGITCLDTRVAWVAAEQSVPDPDKPLGIILHTTDGGKTWVQQAAPTHVGYWKISFAGALR